MDAPVQNQPVQTLTPQQLRSRRARNIALSLTIGALAAIFYAVTVVKLGMRMGPM